MRKGERERMAVPGAFLSEAMVGMAPQIGASVSLRVPRESLEAQPGYYFAFGETLDELADQLSLVRFYFNCRADSAAALFGELTGALNRFHTPFQLKAPTAPAGYGRADAAVLYVGARYFPIVARLVLQMRDRVPLEDAVPLFTKRLVAGRRRGDGTRARARASDPIALASRPRVWSRPGGTATAGGRRGSRLWPSVSPPQVSMWRGPGLGPGAADQFLLPAAARLS